MVCGKLMDEGRQLSNTQLVVEERQLKLQDADGVLLKVDSEPHDEVLQPRKEANSVWSDVVSEEGSEQQLTIDNCQEELK